ncbi:glyoxalase [Halobacillus sp. B23F22_1]|uniref:glyoxalase n=1 Tax=Halobacillus sp. B23F22_1 TaxID=3459514 RepID=UPI00373F0942
MEFKEVKLHTNKFDELHTFYSAVLGFPIEEKSKTHITLKAGKSRLTFVRSDQSSFYHFAFNLAVDHFDEAKKMIKQLVKLNEEDGNDEIYFSYSNARAFYFLDPAGNVVEFIERRNYSEKIKGGFSVQKILDIGEVSFTSKCVNEHASQLIKAGISVRDGDHLEEDQLNFMGEQGRYLLVGPPGRKWLFSHQNAESHPLHIHCASGLVLELTPNGELEIR